MQDLQRTSQRRLRIASVRLPDLRDGVARAIRVAAKCRKRDLLADPDNAPQWIELPAKLVARINELTPDFTLEENDGTNDGTTANAMD